MSQLEDLLNRQRNVMNNIQKSFGSGFDMNEELEKARHGVYADNATNRKLNRVGQEYGHAAKEKEKSPKVKSGGQDDSGYQKMAKEASDKALKRASEDENADPKVREMAKKELKSRGDSKTSKEDDSSKKNSTSTNDNDDEKLLNDIFDLKNEISKIRTEYDDLDKRHKKLSRQAAMYDKDSDIGSTIQKYLSNVKSNIEDNRNLLKTKKVLLEKLEGDFTARMKKDDKKLNADEIVFSKMSYPIEWMSESDIHSFLDFTDNGPKSSLKKQLKDESKFSDKKLVYYKTLADHYSSKNFPNKRYEKNMKKWSGLFDEEIKNRIVKNQDRMGGDSNTFTYKGGKIQRVN